ncbi:transcriptional regulator with XRE-family HTH domain [Staphylococcus cohnii]
MRRKRGAKMSNQRYKELRLLLEREGIRHKEVADMIGMNPARFSQKINRNKSNFTIDEASAICDALDISMDEYFFNKNVSKMKRKV